MGTHASSMQVAARVSGTATVAAWVRAGTAQTTCTSAPIQSTTHVPSTRAAALVPSSKLERGLAATTTLDLQESLTHATFTKGAALQGTAAITPQALGMGGIVLTASTLMQTPSSTIARSTSSAVAALYTRV